MSATPAGGADSAPSFGLDPTFSQFELVGEIERRYELGGQPGTIKMTGFLIRGRMGNFEDALALSQATGLDANEALAAVRTYQSRPGVSLNLAQQVTDTVGVFGRAGWADGNVEPWDNTDCDRTIEAGVSLGGKCWKRPDDTIGIAGVINGISNAHMEYFNAGSSCERTSKSQSAYCKRDGRLPAPSALEPLLSRATRTDSSNSNRRSLED